MFKNRSLRVKLLAVTLVGLLPLAIVLAVFLQVSDQTREATEKECRKLMSDDLDHTLQGIYAMCVTQQESLQGTVNVALKVAQQQMANGGAFRQDPRQTVRWRAVNQ